MDLSEDNGYSKSPAKTPHVGGDMLFVNIGDQARISDVRKGVCLITISYRGDFEIARELCISIDRFANPEIEHLLIVPRADLALFAPLSIKGRRLIAKEDVLPRGYTREHPHKIDLGYAYRPLIRDIWWGPTGQVRGWIVQQIAKLSAPAITDRDVIVFADSDILLVRPVAASLFTDHNGVRLYRVPDATQDSAIHQKWHAVSGRLLGLQGKPYFGADYIGHLVSWRRDVILELQTRLVAIAGQRWDIVIAREPAFSEYILYGIFAEHVLGLKQCGHSPSRQDLVHAGWRYRLNTLSGLHEFVEGLEPHHVAVAIQSTDRFTVDERRALIQRTLNSR